MKNIFSKIIITLILFRVIVIVMIPNSLAQSVSNYQKALGYSTDGGLRNYARALYYFQEAKKEDPENTSIDSLRQDVSIKMNNEINQCIKNGEKYIEEGGAINAYKAIVQFELIISIFTKHSKADSLLKIAQAHTNLIDNRDNNKYPTVRIGNQLWMASNLNYASKGSVCPEVQGSSACDSLGRLYNWLVLMGDNHLENSQGICPTGWRVPSLQDWENLLIRFGGYRKETISNLKNAGFTHQPAGYCTPKTCWGAMSESFYWTSTTRQRSDIVPYYIAMQKPLHGAFQSVKSLYDYGDVNSFSCRCVTDIINNH